MMCGWSSGGDVLRLNANFRIAVQENRSHGRGARTSGPVTTSQDFRANFAFTALLDGRKCGWMWLCEENPGTVDWGWDDCTRRRGRGRAEGARGQGRGCGVVAVALGVDHQAVLYIMCLAVVGRLLELTGRGVGGQHRLRRIHGVLEMLRWRRLRTMVKERLLVLKVHHLLGTGRNESHGKAV
jgi:hypothetical protein